MRILDRYIARIFVLNYAILFVVIIGLIILLDLITNFDEFVQYAQTVEGDSWHLFKRTIRSMWRYYTPMIFLMFAYLGGLLPIAAAAFTLATLNRKRELTAILASGISMQRVAMPLFVLGFVTTMAMVVNQELVLPNLADRLSMKHRDIKHGRVSSFEKFYIRDTDGSLWSTSKFDPEHDTMEDINILQREKAGDYHFGRAHTRIVAEGASWDDERKGWILKNAIIEKRRDTQDERSESAPAALGRNAVKEYFIASQLDPVTIKMRYRSGFRELQSIRQIQEMIENQEGVVDTASLKRIIHSRFSMPVVNMLILIIGVPFFLIRAPGNLMIPAVKMAGVAVGVWATASVMVRITPGTLLSPAAVAWLPIAILVPVAYWRMDTIQS